MQALVIPVLHLALGLMSYVLHHYANTSHEKQVNLNLKTSLCF